MNRVRESLCIIAITLVAGCSVFQTITPETPVSRSNTVDHTTPPQYSRMATSGVLAKNTDHSGVVVSILVTTGFVDYAKWLVENYGDQLTPPMAAIDGMTETTDQWGNKLFTIPTESFDKLRIMARWSKDPNHPKTTRLQKLVDKVL